MTNPHFEDNTSKHENQIRLTLLGPADLRDASGAEITAVLAQSKRLALLAYLATAPQGRFRRRDTVLGLFWPDADEASARNSLNRSVSFLRGWLGEGAVVSRGRDEIAVAPDRIWCDVAAFEAAIGAGAFEVAVDLYGGDLLDGFLLAGSTELDSWIARERARLRQRACNAAWTLAAGAEEAGDLDGALSRARQALELDLLDEPALRRLLALLDRAGDRLGAARAYADFVRLLDREYEMEPSPETRALMEAVRSRVRAHSGSAAAAPVTTEQAIAPPAAISRPSRGAATNADRARGRLLHLFAGRGAIGVALAAVTLFAAFLAWPAVPHGPMKDDGTWTVLVLPFAHTGDADVAFLGDGAATILSSNLMMPGVISTVDTRAVQAYLHRRPVDPKLADAVRAVASHFQADLVVAGAVSALNGQLRVDASLLDMRNQGERLANVALRGLSANTFDVFDDVSRQLLAVIPGTPNTHLSRTAARSTSSLPALRAYLEGERHYRLGRIPEAIEAYRTAMREDSTFALAHYRFNVAGDWAGSVPGQGKALARARRHAERLPELERMLIEAWAAYRQADPERAEFLYEKILREQPHNIEAWYRLGEVHFHWGAALGRSYTVARNAFERTRAYDPDNVHALTHLARIAAAERRRESFDTLFNELPRLEPGDQIEGEAELLRAFTFGDAAAQARAFNRVAAQPRPRVLQAIRLLTAHTTNFPAAARLAAALSEQPGANAEEALAARAAIELARGRPTSARGLFADPLGHPALEFRALAVGLPWLPAENADLLQMRRELTAVRNQAASNAMYPPRRLFLEGLLAVRTTDRAAVEAVLARLRDPNAFQAPYDRNARFFAATIEAAMLDAEGRSADALAALGPPPPGWLAPTAFNYASSYARYLRAGLLAKMGRDAEALKWFATFPEPDGSDVEFRAAAELEQARIEERRGNPERAAAHLAAAAELWRDAEPAVHALLARANRRGN